MGEQQGGCEGPQGNCGGVHGKVKGKPRRRLRGSHGNTVKKFRRGCGEAVRSW